MNIPLLPIIKVLREEAKKRNIYLDLSAARQIAISIKKVIEDANPDNRPSYD